MKKPNFVFDAWALVAFFKNELPAANRIEELLYGASNDELALGLSWINLGEAYYAIGRSKGKAFAEQTLTQIRRLPITLWPLDEPLVLQAATYKMTYALSYADCFALATAVRQDATLLTGDPEFDKLGGQYKLERLRSSRHSQR